jgi:phospholipid/cholesterol/gamma-HCH transport system permease protein
MERKTPVSFEEWHTGGVATCQRANVNQTLVPTRWTGVDGKDFAMNVDVRVDRKLDHAIIVLSGPFDLAHSTEVMRAVQRAEAHLEGCHLAELGLTQVNRIDGTGAVLLARLLEHLATNGCRTEVIAGGNPEAARLLSLYHRHKIGQPSLPPRTMNPFARLGAIAAEVPAKTNDAFDFTGRCAAALPRAVAAPFSVDWRSIPRLMQEIGADAWPVTSIASLLVGVIVGFLGVSQLGRFGAVAFVPELVVVAHFRELCPLITAIVVAGRSGAGLASEIATMKVSEEIDALRSMGFDPVRWLVVPRCLALVLTLPFLAWIGDLFGLVGGLAATMAITKMTARAYIQDTLSHITIAHLLVGLVKTPFLALAIGLIACGNGLATQGGAAAVGSRTTSAVVQSIFGVIVISTIFTFLFTFMGS